MNKKICFYLALQTIFGIIFYAEAETISIDAECAVFNVSYSKEISACKNSIENLKDIIESEGGFFSIKKIIDAEPFVQRGNKVNIYGKYDDPYFSRNDLRRSGFFSRAYIEKAYPNNLTAAAGAGFKKTGITLDSVESDNSEAAGFINLKKVFGRKHKQFYELENYKNELQYLREQYKYIENNSVIKILRDYSELLKINAEINFLRRKKNIISKFAEIIGKQIESGLKGKIELEEILASRLSVENEIEISEIEAQNKAAFFYFEYCAVNNSGAGEKEKFSGNIYFAINSENIIFNEIDYSEVFDECGENIKTGNYAGRIAADIKSNEISISEIRANEKPEISAFAEYIVKTNDVDNNRLGGEWNNEFTFKLGFHYTFDSGYKRGLRKKLEIRNNELLGKKNGYALNAENKIALYKSAADKIEYQRKLYEKSRDEMLRIINIYEKNSAYSEIDYRLIISKYERLFEMERKIRSIEIERINIIANALAVSEMNVREYFLSAIARSGVKKRNE